MQNSHSFSGRKIDPPDIFPNMTASQLINFFGATGYNARRLAEAAEITKQMIETDSTVCLTLAGAMTPLGMGKAIATMIQNGFIDWIITTGANIYHLLGRAAKEASSHPEKSFMVAAYENNVPVYIPAIGDSSIGLNMLPLLLRDNNSN